MSETVLIVLALIIAIGVAAILVLLLRPRQAPVDHAAEQRMAGLNAQIKAMGEMLANAQSQLQQSVSHRLDTVTQHLGESMKTSTKNTTDHLQQLHERLAVIDNAQKSIGDLASQMTSLQNVLGSKQQRGAFGQGRMEIIIQDALPKGCYEFQYTLSNKARPDCCIMMPDKRPLVIDSKFPLEAVTAFREAKNDEERKQAAARLRQDIGKHVTDIAQKYLLPGETQDMALMFVPSESVYAELYDGFDDIVQKAYRAKVVIVSPSLLMLAVQVVQQIQKDARMRAAADKIHAEVGYLMEDLRRLQERVGKLKGHFGQANDDLKLLETSAEKIETRATRIREVEFGDDGGDTSNVIPAPIRKLEAGE
jgi:DNA recombination protein RmuC